MKPASITELKKELKYRSHDQLVDYCLTMARFKLESKELLNYLVFESENEESYIQGVKSYISTSFLEINTNSYHYIKKSTRKILRQTKRFIRYSKKKDTEAQLLLHFCQELLDIKPSIRRNAVLVNMYNRQLIMAQKAIDKLHEDLQYDYQLLLEDFPKL